MTAVKDEQGQINHYVSNFSDITDRKASEDKIKSLAFYDSLTGLPNRRLLAERLEHAVTLNARTGHHGALLFLDLDNFKLLNDTQGHGAGDELLTEVARRLKGCVRKADSVARLGGDEFVVLMEKFNQASDQVAIQVKTVAEKIIVVLAEPYHLSTVLHHCSCSIGIVLFNGSDKTAAMLMSQADTAMYAAKKMGKNAYRFFDQVMQQELEQRAKFELSLRQAIDNEQFELFYQPEVDDENRIIGVEALIRWHHPELGLILPARFLPLAEETGIILIIGRWVLETACKQLKAWRNLPSTEKLSISVNISAKQLYQPDFVETVREIVEKYAIDPWQLKLELTEKMVLEKIDTSIGKMLSLKGIGVVLSMHNFGTGYSSLSYLRTLPFDQIKIDKSFMDGIKENSTDAFIVKSVLNLGQLLGINVVVEGIENAEQHKIVKSIGGKVFQGYFLGHPVPVDELEAIFAPSF
jgi:diguanylate cyclase (GGDEF)-like protein